MILELAEKDYNVIAEARKSLMMLGDLSESELLELTILCFFNETQHKSPKVEYYMVGRFLHTRPKGKISKLKSLLEYFKLG